jgi:flagellar biosynthesis chaperone FliJ
VGRESYGQSQFNVAEIGDVYFNNIGAGLMNQNRMGKFERMLHYQSNQVDLLQQQIASQQASISRLNEELAILKRHLETAQTGNDLGTESLASLQQRELSILEMAKRVKLKKSQIATAQEQLDHLWHRFKEEDRRLKGWEKLVERESSKQVSFVRNLEQRQADELFLLSKFAGEHR